MSLGEDFDKDDGTTCGFSFKVFLRNANESGFSSDNRRFGGIVRQKRKDRQDNALFSKYVSAQSLRHLDKTSTNLTFVPSPVSGKIESKHRRCLKHDIRPYHNNGDS